MTKPKLEDLVGEEDDLSVPELSDEILEKPETPSPEEAHEHVFEDIPDLSLDEDMIVKEKKKRKIPGKSLLRQVPLVNKLTKVKKDVGSMLPAAEPPPNPSSGAELGQPATQETTGAPLTPIAPTSNSPVAPEDRIVGETQSFEEYNTFQKSEATASDLESLVMLERAIAKGEQRRTGDNKVQMYITAAAVLMIVTVIAIYMAMELGILDFLN